jgi:hypothetical protein
MSRPIGYGIAVVEVVVGRGQKLAGFNEHFADMLVAMHAACNGRQMVEIEHIHIYLSTISTAIIQQEGWGLCRWSRASSLPTYGVVSLRSSPKPQPPKTYAKANSASTA